MGSILCINCLFDIMIKWRVLFAKFEIITRGAHFLFLFPSSLSLFLSCLPLLLLSCVWQPPTKESKERERERVRERGRVHEIAPNSGKRTRSPNLAYWSAPLVIPLPISLYFRVFVFLGFRWKPAELYQIEYSVPLLFLKCLLVDFVFQFVTKFPIYGFAQNRLGFWYRSFKLTRTRNPNRVCEWVGALMTKLIDNQTELRHK